MRTWIKLYIEILSDPLMGRLSDRQYRTCINLFLMAGLVDKHGRLGTAGDIAWTLHLPPHELAVDLNILTGAQVVAQEAGVWHVCHFEPRQARAPSAQPEQVAERVRAHRQRKRIEEVTQAATTPCNEGVTSACNEGEEKRGEEKRREEKRREDIDAAATPALETDPRNAQFFELLHRAGMVLSPLMAEQYQDILSETTGFALIEEAFVEAANTDSRPTPMWLRAVLDRCHRDHCRPGQWPDSHRPRGRNAPRNDSEPVPMKRTIADIPKGSLQEGEDEDDDALSHQTPS